MSFQWFDSKGFDMRCPVCRSDTTPTMSRCARCNASLIDSTTSAEMAAEDPPGWPPQPWQPDSLEAEPWPPEPWSPDPNPADSPVVPPPVVPPPAAPPPAAPPPAETWRPEPAAAGDWRPTPLDAAPLDAAPLDGTAYDATAYDGTAYDATAYDATPDQLSAPPQAQPWQPEPWRPEPLGAESPPWTPGPESWARNQPWRVDVAEAGATTPVAQGGATGYVPGGVGGHVPAGVPETPRRQPPPGPPRKRNGALLIGACAVVILASAVAVGIILWPQESRSPGGALAPQAGTTESTVAGTPPNPDPSPSTSPADTDGAAQATEVNSVLDEMAGSRSQLGRAMLAAEQCSALGASLPTLEKVVGQRERQLASAKNLQVGALDSGEELKDALTRALQASLDADRAYLSWADNARGCAGATPSDADLERGNEISENRATPAKREFLRLWASVAEQEGQPARDKDDI